MTKALYICGLFELSDDFDGDTNQAINKMLEYRLSNIAEENRERTDSTELTEYEIKIIEQYVKIIKNNALKDFEKGFKLSGIFGIIDIEKKSNE